MAERSYLIIGAGPSGLATARALSELGIAYDVVERHSDVGGIWDIDNPGSPMYDSAHFISSKTLSGFAGFPMPEAYPDYPSHRQILAYLRDFAKAHDLYPAIQLNTSVQRIERGPAGWTVTLSDGERRVYRGVVMASGTQWVPHLPSYPGRFDGEVLHSVDYRSSDQFRGKRVLVVGAGNSGCDIACDAAVAAESAAISLRRGYRFFPKHFFGMPSDVFAHGGPKLPGWLEQRVLGLLVDVMIGKPQRFGLPAPDHKALASHPIMNTQILHHLGHGDLTAMHDVAELAGDEVRFVDGTSLTVEMIVWATGYEVAFPYLDRDHFDWRARNPQLFLNVFSRAEDDLFAVGLVETDAGAYPIIGLQAELVAQVIDDLHHRPERAAAFRAHKQTEPDLTGGVEHIGSARHSYYIQDAAYRRYAGELLDRLRAGTVGQARPARRRWSPVALRG